MKSFDVTIKGTTPLLQHRFGEAAEGDSGKATRRVAIKNEAPREQAEKACYRDDDGTLYFPGAAIARLLREAGGGHKQRGSRKSLKFILPAAVLVLDDVVPLFNANDKKAKEFEVDSRPVVIPSTKGRIMRHRPRLDEWSAKFRLRVNETVLDADIVQQLLVEGGQQIGIGDFRPEKGGPFGTFHVVEWREGKA